MKNYADKRYFDNIKEAQREAGKYDSALKKCLDTLIMNDSDSKIYQKADAEFSDIIIKMMNSKRRIYHVVKVYCDAYETMLKLFKKKIDKSKSPCFDLTFLKLKENKTYNEKNYSNN